MTLNEIKPLLPNLKTNQHDEYIGTVLPILEGYAKDWCGNAFEEDAEGKTIYPPGVKLFIAKAIEYLMNKAGVSSMTMGAVSYSYDLDFPPSLTKMLRPYKKVRWS